ncbi:MAG: hypothetical protein ABI042_19195 [Verrucomicrobiota bacterium]
MESEKIEYFKTTCDNCKQPIEFPDELYDEEITCPTCQTKIKAIPDDEKVDPEQDREWLEGDLLEEQQEGILLKRISEAKKKEMLKAQADSGYSCVFDLVVENFPDLLTKKGKQRLQEEKIERAKDESEYNKDNKVKEFAPLVTIKKLPSKSESERKATEPQIKYLRDLGVRDEFALANLGVKQASDLIAKILEERNKPGILKQLFKKLFQNQHDGT